MSDSSVPPPNDSTDFEKGSPVGHRASNLQFAHEAVGAQEAVRVEHWYDGFKRLFLWYPSYLSKEEKKLLIKLDYSILTYICLSYFTKSLDKSNITNAYITNMKEDINMTGNDLSYAKSLFSAGYIVSMCFGIMFVTRPWARYMLPTLECLWGVLTACQAAVKNPQQLFALRFLIGLAEGPIFPAAVFILGSWYGRDEIYRRVMVFSVSSSIGSMFSGFLQSAVYASANGKHNIAGWQYGFIVDGAGLTIPIALIGFFVFPGTPQQVKKLWYLKEEELELAKKRLERSGIATPTKLTPEVLKKTFTRWHIYLFSAMWILLNVVALPDGLGLQLWLTSKPDSFSIEQRNNYPTIQSAVGIVAQFLLGGLSDSYPIYYFLTITQLLFILSYSSLAAWNIPDAYRWFCFMIIGFDSVNQTIVSGWINRACRNDAEERAVVLGFSDAVSQAMNIWTNIVFYPTSQAPQFRLGYIVSTGAAFIMLLLPIWGYYGEKSDGKKLEDQLTEKLEASRVLTEDEVSGSEEFGKVAGVKEPVLVSSLEK
jgi:MFS transporter, ACS family, pantothenate transporter